MISFPRLWKYFLSGSDISSKIDHSAPISYHLEIGSLSDTGSSRPINQDYIGLFNASDDTDYLAIVADGMGGHRAGDVASRVAVETIQQNYFSLLKELTPEQALHQTFQEANTAVLTLARQHPDYRGMGTTLVALSLHQSAAHFAYTGDSRLYLIRNGTIHQLSQDHTLVAEMLRKGLISAEQAKHHPDKHIITHAVGTQEKVFVDISESPISLQQNDCFLLCSDGLYDLVSDDEMLNDAMQFSAQQACHELVQLANARGGYDNISVVIIKILEKPIVEQSIPITLS